MHLDIIWWRLVTILPIASVLGAALGLSIGTRADPRKVPLIFGLVVIPITFLGATYYPWAVLTPIPWLKTVVLLNPLVYMSEGMRVSLTPYVQHMPLWGIYGGMILFTALLGARASRGSSSACRPDERLPRGYFRRNHQMKRPPIARPPKVARMMVAATTLTARIPIMRGT